MYLRRYLFRDTLLRTYVQIEGYYWQGIHLQEQGVTLSVDFSLSSVNINNNYTIFVVQVLRIDKKYRN